MTTRPLLAISRTLYYYSPGCSTNISRLVLQRTFPTVQVQFYATAPAQGEVAPPTEKGEPPSKKKQLPHGMQYEEIAKFSPAVSVTSGSPIDIDTVIKSRLHDVKSGTYKDIDHPEDLQHFRKKPPDLSAIRATDPTMVPRDPDSLTTPTTTDGYNLPHPIWSEEELHDIQITHKQPEGIRDKAAFYSVKGIRGFYDAISGYNRRPRDVRMWLNRIIFLETVAGVPGMVAAMVRHLHSLRRMRRDHGWIHTLLEEAENERMHLMTALQLRQPSIFFRATVMGAQGVFVSLFSLAYLISPRYCHRFVGYLEEEAVVTYTKCLKDIDEGLLKHWQTQQAPIIAKNYWRLHPAATMKDVILAIRADEAHHRVVNHTLASLKDDDFNPYKPGY